MKLTGKWLSTGKWVVLCLIAMALVWMASAQTVTTTTVQGTVYLANGLPGTGTLQLSWPAFTTANNQAVAAGRTTVTIGVDGFVSVNLAPNLSSWPAGLYYTATYYLSDGTTSTEYWVVPAAAQASIAQVRAQVMPAAQAVQAVSKAYVDQAIQSIPQSSLTPSGGTMSGPLYLSGDPLQALQAADKHYVDSALSQAVPLTGATLTGPINGPSLNASVNKVLLVTAPPYNAKCDGVTDDQGAIQAAFNDAYSNGYSVQFPAGTCLTSTVTIKGQSFFGAGEGITFVQGQPGQDVFATPDAAGNLLTYASIHDMTIQVDGSVNAASSAVGGNNTFQNRITGTAGGTTPLATPPAPGPMVFDSTMSGNCGGSMSASLSTLTVSCGYFTSVASSLVVGQAITVNGAGVSGANLVTTVAGVVNGTQITLAAAASTTVSNATVTLATPLTPPWYIGNCGIAVPASSGAAMEGGLLDWSLTNVYFQAVNGPGIGGNYVCGLFIQAQPYGWRYTNLDFMNFWAGLIEAPPASNNTSYNDWTPDTSSYKDINFRNTILPMVWYNGSNRSVQGVSIYGTQRLFTLGMWHFAQSLGSSPTAYPSGTFSRYYDECFTPATGEHARWVTDRASSDVFAGSDLAVCGGASYLNFAVNNSTIEGKIGSTLQINGNQNVFRNTGLSLGEVTDNGLDNSVQGGENDSSASAQRRVYVGSIPTQEPVGKLDAGFVLNGNSTSPFLSGSDLVLTARDFSRAVAGLSGTVVNDPTGAEMTHSYVHTVGTAAFGSGGAGYNGLFTVGTRIPTDQLYVLVNGECEGATACNTYLKIWDSTTNAQIGSSCVLNFTSTWTTEGGPSSKDKCLIDFSAIAPGDLIEFRENTWTGTGLTGVRRSFFAFQPMQTDVLNAVTLNAATFSGADLSIKVNACLAAVEAAGGGTCDARALYTGGSNTASQNIVVGDGVNNVTLILPNGLISAASGVQLIPRSYSHIIGQGKGDTSHNSDDTRWACASPAANFGCVQTHSAGAAYASISDLLIDTSGTVGGGATGLSLGGTGFADPQNMTISNVRVSSYGEFDIGMHMVGAYGCACYNTFRDDDFGGASYDQKVDGGSNSNKFYGGILGGNSGTGLYDAGGKNTYFHPDIEHATGHGMDLEGGQADVIAPYLELNGADLINGTQNFVLSPFVTGNSVYSPSSASTSTTGFWWGAQTAPNSIGLSVWNSQNAQILFGAQSPNDTYHAYGTLAYIWGDKHNPLDWSFVSGGQNQANTGITGHAPFKVGFTTTYGGHLAKGFFSTAAMANPSAPTITNGGTAGSTTYQYQIVCHDWNSGVTLASATGQTTTGNATLSATNYNLITMSCPDGTEDYDVLKYNGSAWQSLYLAVFGNGPASNYPLEDTGGATSAYTLPVRNTTGDASVAGQLTVTGAATLNGITTPTAVGNATFTQTIASGSLALATSSIGSGACQTVTAGSVNSAAATGVLSTDTINATLNGSVVGITGYTPATTGGLQINPYPTAGYVNFDVCNRSSASITPGAVTLNWKVMR